MTDFTSAYDAWSSADFPPGSKDEELNDLHADLALVDTWVAESVIPFVEDGRHTPAKVDVNGKVNELRAKATEIERARTGADSELARRYISYLDALEAVYDGFLEQG